MPGGCTMPAANSANKKGKQAVNNSVTKNTAGKQSTHRPKKNAAATSISWRVKTPEAGTKAPKTANQQILPISGRNKRRARTRGLALDRHTGSKEER